MCELTARHSRGTAWARHAMCESALTPSKVLLEKLTVSHLVNTFLAILCNSKVHYRVHKYPPLYLYPKPDQFSPLIHSISLRSIFTVSYRLRLGLPSSLFPSCISTKNPCMESPCSPFVLHAQCISFFLDLIALKAYRSCSPSFCSLLQFPITLSLLDPNFFHHTKYTHTSL
jgi:hypothetical protein